jgi:hypothetical protein
MRGVCDWDNHHYLCHRISRHCVSHWRRLHHGLDGFEWRLRVVQDLEVAGNPLKSASQEP